MLRVLGLGLRLTVSRGLGFEVWGERQSRMRNGARKTHQSGFLSHKVFSKSICRSQLPYEFVNLSFTITNIKNELTDLCGK